MLCAISGEAPQEPVASKKSGNVFEKRLIEAYISENGTDPVTNEELTVEDLVDLKQARIVRPRPPTLTSIPALLSVFQNEWDALALETYQLKQQLAQTRQELSTALYQHDAAVRVIARLSRERDEAREALSKLSINGNSAGAGDAMQVDNAGLPESLAAIVTETQARLSKTRRKRPVPEDWATSDLVSSFQPNKLATAAKGARSLAVTSAGDKILRPGPKNTVQVISLADKEIVETIEPQAGNVTAVAWVKDTAAIGTSTGAVKLYDDGKESSSFNHHAGEATALAPHPSGALLASVGVDKSFIFYDVENSTIATQVFTNSALACCAFHPDGHLFAAGGADGEIKVYDVKTGTSAANLEASGPLRSLNFSENGIWLAAVSEGQTNVQIWDLRTASVAKTLEIGSAVESVKWDYTGQFLVAGGPSGICVQQYTKASKEWSEVLRAAVPSVEVEWTAEAKSIVSLGSNGVLTELSAA